MFWGIGVSYQDGVMLATESGPWLLPDAIFCPGEYCSTILHHAQMHSGIVMVVSNGASIPDTAARTLTGSSFYV